MTDFLIGQIVGLNGLVNLSNLVFLLAFSVRDILILRVLSVASYCLVLPYYYFQSQPLWPPIVWGVAFIIVNGVRIIILALERRPVVLSSKEDELYRLTFSSVGKREFLRLVTLAQWVECSPGEVILGKGQQIADAIVLISGEVEAVLGGETKVPLLPGQLIGDVNAYSGLANPVDVVARGHARLAKWDLKHLREFTGSRPELRAKLLQIQSADFAAKLREVTSMCF